MEKMKKIIIAKTVLFSVLLLLPSILWPIFKSHLDTGNYEQRALAEFPTLQNTGKREYTKKLEAYYNDHLPFRNQMIWGVNYLTYYLLHSSPNVEVIKGKNDWLFYNSSLARKDYTGENQFKKRELKRISENLLLTRDNLKKQGCEFVLFLVPDKERMYSEYLPQYCGKPGRIYRTQQVYQYLKENTDLNVIYPYEDLMEAKKKYFIYHKTDTHWNTLGAYIASVQLLEHLGIFLPDYREAHVVEKEDVPGDLSYMLYLHKNISPGTDYAPFFEDAFRETVEIEKEDFSTEFIYHNKTGDDRRLMVNRDSFFSNMSHVIALQFKESYMTNISVYNHNMLKEYQPDIFIYETTERYIENLLKFSFTGM